MPIEFTSDLASAGATYSTDDDMVKQYGSSNIASWADLDNDGDADKILARKLWARQKAWAEINAILRRGLYTIPFVAPYDNTIVTMEAALSGVFLYESRGITDYDENTGQARHALIWQKREAYKQLREILAGRRRLDVSAEPGVASYPQSVRERDLDNDGERPVFPPYSSPPLQTEFDTDTRLG